MTKTIEVEIDDIGTIRPTDPAASLPHGRALLVWHTEPDDVMLLSETSLAVDWLRPEEDEAWSHMRIVDDGLPFFPSTGRVITSEMVKAAQDDDLA